MFFVRARPDTLFQPVQFRLNSDYGRGNSPTPCHDGTAPQRDRREESSRRDSQSVGDQRQQKSKHRAPHLFRYVLGVLVTRQ